ncbi:hypothetical protein [Chengkuizengella marina]|uniref:Uncharacterized protein n=1 Tax=Chengkuizengella marina TaxID=2507566 RepID=A0A6N9Q801_9BACL|nr:hypothetical protein [Chengkuizengella marina]NBI30997.1 hypothetical protein [Chengkuizengella marina]
MKQIIFLAVGLLFIGLLVVMVGDDEKNNSEQIREATRYADRIISDSGEVTAMSFDGDRLVKYRVMVEDSVTKEQVEGIINEFMELSKSKYTDIWEDANLNFDFKIWSNGDLIYKGHKDAGSKLDWD